MDENKINSEYFSENKPDLIKRDVKKDIQAYSESVDIRDRKITLLSITEDIRHYTALKKEHRGDSLRLIEKRILEYAEQYHKQELEKVMPTYDDAELYLQDEKDVYSHPYISNRNKDDSYDVVDLLIEFALKWLKQSLKPK